MEAAVSGDIGYNGFSKHAKVRIFSEYIHLSVPKLAETPAEDHFYFAISLGKRIFVPVNSQ